ncbi:MAG: hypothetical protein RMJ59_01245 [Candidatus Nitrosocaldus sp.]|nr:hypothetical protein [Candidatus Nitrosocaldus sp.]MDW8274990.1 hypothetical protein [Candidatus Nitrosocaldus sp.]
MHKGKDEKGRREKEKKAAEIARKKSMYKFIAIAAIAAIVGIAAAVSYAYYLHTEAERSRTAAFGPVDEKEHVHAVFKLYIHGKEPVDFAQRKYQLRSPYIHFENNNGFIIHRHAANVDIGYLFESMKMKFSRDCFTLDDGRSYCNDGTNTLKFYVNGMPNDQYNRYVIQDGDRILITYGSESEEQIREQLKAVDRLAGINE